MITKIEINPNEVYESVKIRYANIVGFRLNIVNLAWLDFLEDNNIELIPQIDPCTMESKGNGFVVCNDPVGKSHSLKIPEQLAVILSGNPYFDNKITEADFPNIDNMLNNLSEEDKKIVEKAKEFGDGSGNRNMEVTITVSISCDWNGDPWNPEVSVSSNTLKYGVDWDKVKEIEDNAKKQIFNTVSEYKNIVQRIASDLKISSDELNRHIMGWL
jgi:hypothetical protein